MKTTQLFIPFLLVLFIVSIKSIAQDKASSDSIVKTVSTEKHSYGLVSTNYNSNIVFLGRKSLSKAPYLSAFAGYYHKSGLFINGGASYLAASGVNRFDLFTLTTGYDYYLKSFSAGLYGTKYFFNNKSTTVKSELSGYVGAYANYDFDIADVYIDASAYFGNTSDFILGTAVSHIFYAANDKLRITPTFYLNAGTQNYYSNYNNNRRFGRHMLNGGGPQSTGSGMMGVGSFKVLDYEWSVPVTYTLKKLRISFTPVFTIPLSAATITNGQDTYKEDLSNSFFWSLGLSYQIILNNKKHIP